MRRVVIVPVHAVWSLAAQSLTCSTSPRQVTTISAKAVQMSSSCYICSCRGLLHQFVQLQIRAVSVPPVALLASDSEPWGKASSRPVRLGTCQTMHRAYLRCVHSMHAHCFAMQQGAASSSLACCCHLAPSSQIVIQPRTCVAALGPFLNS